MATRGNYVHNSMLQFFLGIPKMLVLCNFLKILMVSDKNDSQGLKLVLMHCIQLYEQHPSEKFFIFTIYQNYTLAFNV